MSVPVSDGVMIVGQSYGGLGNQMFAYAAIRMLRENNERIVLFGFEELEELFSQANLRSHTVRLRYRRTMKALWRVFQILIYRLSKAFPALVTVILPTEDRRGFTQPLGKWKLSHFRGGYAQSESLISNHCFDDLFAGLSESLSGALSLAGLAKVQTNDRMTFFVHVRRKDFLDWPSVEKPAAVPVDWFLEQIRQLESRFPHSEFLCLSDDPLFALVISQSVPGVRVLDVPAPEALVIMGMCDGGILSPSTFSWWAAIYGSGQGRGPYIAPEFWFTWRERAWPEELTPWNEDTRSHKDSRVLDFRPVQNPTG